MILEAAINAIFTGIGTSIGLAIYELYIKKNIHKTHKNIARIMKRLK